MSQGLRAVFLRLWQAIVRPYILAVFLLFLVGLIALVFSVPLVYPAEWLPWVYGVGSAYLAYHIVLMWAVRDGNYKNNYTFIYGLLATSMVFLIYLPLPFHSILIHALIALNLTLGGYFAVYFFSYRMTLTLMIFGATAFLTSWSIHIYLSWPVSRLALGGWLSVLLSYISMPGICLLLQRHFENLYEETIEHRNKLKESRNALSRLVEQHSEEKSTLQEQFFLAQKRGVFGEMAAGIVHNFNNALNMVMLAMGSAELLEEEGEKGREQEEGEELSNQEILLQASRHAGDLSHQLLAFIRQETSFQPRRLSLKKVIDNSLTMMRRVLPSSIQIANEIRDDLPDLWGDLHGLQQAVINLCLNARDAMPQQNGELCFTAAAVTLSDEEAAAHNLLPGAYCQLVVSDNGEGMSRETQEKIFQPFFSTKGERGTGLGLATVFNIITQHGGAIEVESQPGEGTMFTLCLPVATEKERSGQSFSERRLRRKAIRDACILVVDDEVGFCELLCQTLQSAGYRVRRANDGEEALERLQQEEEIHLVLLDWWMPGQGASWLLEEIEALRLSVPVLVMTGMPPGESGNLQEVYAGLVLGLVLKPFERQQILESVEETLTQLELQKEEEEEYLFSPYPAQEGASEESRTK